MHAGGRFTGVSLSCMSYRTVEMRDGGWNYYELTMSGRFGPESFRHKRGQLPPVPSFAYDKKGREALLPVAVPGPLH